MPQCCFSQVSHHHIAMETGRDLSVGTLANEQKLILNFLYPIGELLHSYLHSNSSRHSHEELKNRKIKNQT